MAEPPAKDKASAEHSPLGLPSGSVRALLTLLIVAVVVTEVVRGQQVELMWTETLMIVLAHYFTSRRFIQLPPDILRQLEEEGHLEKETNPLYLPRHTIRALVVAAFLGLAIYLYQQHRILRSESLSILVTVFAYLIGVMGRGLLQWSNKGRQRTPLRWWADAKALIVLVVLAVTAGAHLLDVTRFAPPQLRLAALGLVLFYFGSR